MKWEGKKIEGMPNIFWLAIMSVECWKCSENIQVMFFFEITEFFFPDHLGGVAEEV